ncbi:hypothetical protein H6F51_24845 [Cyanobacteria bacterium FACHB-DQ100]|nr:hypothetical protein [Cyanobacteria bacterium FACHB-DQ100]
MTIGGTLRFSNYHMGEVFFYIPLKMDLRIKGASWHQGIYRTHLGSFAVFSRLVFPEFYVPCSFCIMIFFLNPSLLKAALFESSLIR